MKKKLPADKLTVGYYSRYTPSESKKLERIAKKNNRVSIASLIRDAVLVTYIK